MSLDPARKAAGSRATIAERLAAVSKALEGEDHRRGGGDLPHALPVHHVRRGCRSAAEGGFRPAAEALRAGPANFRPMVGQLWEAMDRGRLRHGDRGAGQALQRRVLQGAHRAAARPRGDRRAATGGRSRTGAMSIRRSSARCWSRPSIRASAAASARITRRAPMSSGWWSRRSSSRCARIGKGALHGGAAEVRRTHQGCRRDGRGVPRRCARRASLDPACGTGNFLYVSLELMKRLEGEVLEALADLGGQEALHGLEGHTVDPHQFLGLEINPRAAIAGNWAWYRPTGIGLRLRRAREQ